MSVSDNNIINIKLKVTVECAGCFPTVESSLRQNQYAHIEDYKITSNPANITELVVSFNASSKKKYEQEELTSLLIQQLESWSFPAKTALPPKNKNNNPENLQQEINHRANSQDEPTKPTSKETPTPPPASASNAIPTLPTVPKSYAAYWHFFYGVIGIGFGLGIPIVMALGIPAARLLSFAFHIPLMGILAPSILLYTIAATSIILTLALGWKTYATAFKQFYYSRSLSMDTLFTISSFATLGVSLAAFYFPGLPMMFEASIMMFGFKHIGQAVKSSYTDHINKNLSYQNLAPKKVKRLINDKEVLSNVAELKFGDIIFIQPGEYLPVDASFFGKNGKIKNTLHTGNLSTISINQYHHVKAGIQNTGSTPLKFRVTKTAAESELSKLDKQLEEAELEESTREQSSRRMLQYFIPGVIVFAAVCGGVASTFVSPTMGIYTALSVLTSACPCTLGYLIPATFAMGMKRARELGIEFKGTKYIENATKIKKVVFDLNGTLTTGKPTVARFDSLCSNIADTKALLNCITIIEGESNHPIANAIINHGLSQAVPLGKNVSNVVKSNAGISGEVGGERYTIGTARFLSSKGISFPKFTAPLTHPHVVYVAKGNQVVARFQLSDPLRPDAKAVVKSLQQQGKEVYICTGAPNRTAEIHAKALGIDLKNISVNCSPTQKREFIIKLQKEAPVAMVGDAANDTLPIAQSNLGIAMKSSHQLTAGKAGAEIKNDSLQPVLNAFVIAEATDTKVSQVLYSSIGYNMIVLAIIGLAFPYFGIMMPPGLCYGSMILQALALNYMASGITTTKAPELELTTQKTEINSSHKTMLNNGLTPEKTNSDMPAATSKSSISQLLDGLFQPIADNTSAQVPENPVTDSWSTRSVC